MDIKRPSVELLSVELIERILDEAFQILNTIGVKIKSERARNLLLEAGANIDEENSVVRIQKGLIEQCLNTAPKKFFLFDRGGNPVVEYGGNKVHFDPGSCGVNILDPETLEHRQSLTHDLIHLVKVTEMLHQYDAQSTSVVCGEVSKEIGDLYRLYIVLMHSSKPIVTGAFKASTINTMFEMLNIFSDNKRPIAIFDVCPSPPLTWDETGAENLIDLARAGIPAEIVSMPLAGSAAPITLLGSVVQHTAECLSGIVLHQCANPGSPIVWGGAPAIFDMRYGTTPMGAIETAMIGASFAQVGKYLNLPTHTYLCATDTKIIDTQAGLESGMTAMIGALSGINMISGAGMLDFLACQSAEKLVIDAEAISMIKRLVNGMMIHTNTLATEFYDGINFKADFLKQKATRKLFSIEQHIPSEIIDRGSIRDWQVKGSTDTFTRAKKMVKELTANYKRPRIEEDKENELVKLVSNICKQKGMEKIFIPE